MECLPDDLLLSIFTARLVELGAPRLPEVVDGDDTEDCEPGGCRTPGLGGCAGLLLWESTWVLPHTPLLPVRPAPSLGGAWAGQGLEIFFNRKKWVKGRVRGGVLLLKESDIKILNLDQQFKASYKPLKFIDSTSLSWDRAVADPVPGMRNVLVNERSPCSRTGDMAAGEDGPQPVRIY